MAVSPLPVASTGAADQLAMSDADVIARVRDGDSALFEVIMRRYNDRLYRVSRAVLGSDADAEDVMQQAYLNAYLHLDQFAGQAAFATWLTRIAVHEALRRARKDGRMPRALEGPDDEPMTDRLPSNGPTPEEQTYRGELSRVLESAVDALPAAFRVVFMLRDVEGLSTREAADCLDLSEDTVKTRLHRARLRLRRDVAQAIGGQAPASFVFQAPRCNRVVTAVLAAIAEHAPRHAADS